MLQSARAIVGIVSDILRLGVLFLRSSSAIRAENLVLRRQLARYVERGIKPRRVDHVTRVSLALFSRLFDWRDAVVIVRPSTIVRWHRMGWRIFWRWKCRSGRPPIPPELRSLIRRRAARRIAFELTAANVIDNHLGHDAARRVVRTQEQHVIRASRHG
jgi:hypothetical protein